MDQVGTINTRLIHNYMRI